MNLISGWADADPTWIWGLVSRGIGLVFLVSFLSLSSQVLPTAGRRGITPIGDSLRRIELDFPTWRRFFYFPTLLWFGAGDAFLSTLPWLGMAGATAIIVGGPWTPLAFAVCYLAYLSLDRPMVLVYPWDCMLFEAGFWGMFLPATHPVPDLQATAAPLPAIAWVFRLLVFRVLFGFGKHKFLGTTPDDKGFLRSFFVNQPLPTPFGWFAYFLPMPVQRLALAVMFVAEIPLPFTVFAPGRWSVVGALSIVNLMLAIWVTGNFGFFNLIVIVLALSWFDTRTALALDPSTFCSSPGHAAIHALVLLHVAISLLSLPFNTFCAQTWMIWPFWERVRPRFLTWPVVLVRALHPFRWVHAYGVFPPQSLPAAKALPVLEASWDGDTWHTIRQHYSPTDESSPPRFCAPHHDRVDQAIVYEGLGINEASIVRNFAGRFDPYGHGGVPGALMLVHRFLEGTAPGGGFYDRALERKHGPPKVARVRTYLFEPSTWSECKAGGWWKKTLVGPHFPPMNRDDGYWDHPLPSPELFHYDDLVWLRRSFVGTLMARAIAGEDIHALVLLNAENVSAEDVERFWSDFVPKLQGWSHRWGGLRRRVEGLRADFDRAVLHRFERVANRYGALLFARLEPLFTDKGILPVFGRVRSTLDVNSSYALRLLCHHVVVLGREEYDRVATDPSHAIERVQEMTMQSGNQLEAVFRYEALVHQSHKLRLLDAYNHQEGRAPLPDKQRRVVERMDRFLRCLYGSMDVADFLKTQFATHEDVLDIEENWPRFAVLRDGKVVRRSP